MTVRNHFKEGSAGSAIHGVAVAVPSAEPVPVRVQLLEDSLLVEAVDGSDAAGSVGTLPLSTVVSVDEVGPSPVGEPALEILFDNGVGLSVVPSADFTDQLITRLRATDGRAEAAALSPALATPAAAAPPPYLGSPPVIDLRAAPTVPHTPIPPLASPQDPVDRGSTPTSTPRRIVAALLIGTLITSLIATAVVANRFHDRATNAEELAEQRAVELRSTRDELDEARRNLAATTATLEATELRVSELTNEKAAVQDERNAAQELARLGADAATMMLDCRDRILDAMSYILDSSYLSVSTVLDAALPVCQAANTAVAAFSDAAA